MSDYVYLGESIEEDCFNSNKGKNDHFRRVPVSNTANIVQGPPGHQGAQGYPGSKGDQGCQGQGGPQGYPGPIGPPGYPGPMGVQGPKGDQGAMGPTGQMGPMGPKGDQGCMGPIGPQGLQGPPGPVGPQGPAPSASCCCGSIGPQGPQGKTGPQGETGPQGKIGPQGETGLQGETGPQGEIGPQGPAGKSCSKCNFVNDSSFECFQTATCPIPSKWQGENVSQTDIGSNIKIIIGTTPTPTAITTAFKYISHTGQYSAMLQPTFSGTTWQKAYIAQKVCGIDPKCCHSLEFWGARLDYGLTLATPDSNLVTSAYVLCGDKIDLIKDNINVVNWLESNSKIVIKILDGIPNQVKLNTAGTQIGDYDFESYNHLQECCCCNDCCSNCNNTCSCNDCCCNWDECIVNNCCIATIVFVAEAANDKSVTPPGVWFIDDVIFS